MDSRLDFESERVSPVFFGEVDLGSKPGLSTCLHGSSPAVTGLFPCTGGRVASIVASRLGNERHDEREARLRS